MARRPSVVPTFKVDYLSVLVFYIYIASIGWGKELHNVLGQIGSQRLPKAPIDLQWEKCCDGPNAFIFDRIFKLSGNEDRHKVLDKFDFGQIELFALELLVLERRIFPIDL